MLVTLNSIILMKYNFYKHPLPSTETHWHKPVCFASFFLTYSPCLGNLCLTGLCWNSSWRHPNDLLQTVLHTHLWANLSWLIWKNSLLWARAWPKLIHEIYRSPVMRKRSVRVTRPLCLSPHPQGFCLMSEKNMQAGRSREDKSGSGEAEQRWAAAEEGSP